MKILTDLNPTSETQEIIYNSLDNMNTMELNERFNAGLMPEYAKHTYRYSELMLGPMMTMMRRGVKIDIEARDKEVSLFEKDLTHYINLFNQLCEGVFGTPINVNSSPQKIALLYQFLAIPEQTKSKKGETKVGTDKDALKKIIKDYPRGAPFCKLMLKISELESQIEFLTKKLPPSNRFLCSYNIAGTETFRLSSSEHPLRYGGNAQNIPGGARYIFVADEGYTFFQADQQGAEARLVAYRSGDPNYIRAVEDGDIHTSVASDVFNLHNDREEAEKTYELAGKSYRQVCKMCGHLTNYYGKAFTMASQAKITTAIAEAFQVNYFKKYPQIAEWHIATANQLQTKGWIENPFGMRRKFWGRRWDDATLREAIAFYPQSAVGVLTNLALYNLWLKYEGQPDAPVQILMNGHDAVIGQFKTDRAAELIPEILACLRIPFQVEDINGKIHDVVIPFDMEIGANWGKASDKNPNGLKKWKAT